MIQGINDYTIEPAPARGEPARVAVYGHGTYEPSSVLAGQHRRVFVAHYDSVDKARAAYPRAAVSGSTKRYTGGDLAALSGLPAGCPPSWFDEMAAGERWDPLD